MQSDTSPFYFVAVGFHPNERVQIKLPGPNGRNLESKEEKASPAGVFHCGFKSQDT